jgi:hypothetical protein
MLSVADYVALERRNFGIEHLEGLTLEKVQSKMRAARIVAQEDPGEITERSWQQWYNVYLQMLWDDIDVCPEGYRWEPLTLTC